MCTSPLEFVNRLPFQVVSDNPRIPEHLLLYRVGAEFVIIESSEMQGEALSLIVSIRKGALFKCWISTITLSSCPGDIF